MFNATPGGANASLVVPEQIGYCLRVTGQSVTPETNCLVLCRGRVISNEPFAFDKEIISTDG